MSEPGLTRDPTKPEGTPGSLLPPGAEPDERPKPLRATEVARALLNRYATATDEHSSVEISRNAKGDPQFRVAVRDADPAAAAAEAIRLYNMLDELFPILAGQSNRPSD